MTAERQQQLRTSEVARAKVNLTLDVLGRLPNGYHALRSLVAFASVGDRLHETSSSEAGVFRLQVTGAFGRALVGENLIDRAAGLVSQHWPDADIPSIVLEKNLPVAAGIGGGSADAAAFLRIVQRRNPGLGTDREWLDLAGHLGADVPVCLASRPTLMMGTGDVFRPVAFERLIPAILVNPLSAVPPTKTRDVFRALDAAEIAETEMVPAVRKRSSPVTAATVAQMIQGGDNDLHGPAVSVVPDIGRVIAALRAAAPGAIVRLSGAGPTCFALMSGHGEARSVARMLSRAHPDWWVRATALGPSTSE